MKKVVYRYRGEQSWFLIDDDDDGRRVFDREFGNERYVFVGVNDLTPEEKASLDANKV